MIDHLFNGRFLGLILAPSIANKCWRNLQIESSGNYGENDIKELLSRGGLGHAFPTEHQCAEKLGTINAHVEEDKNKKLEYSNCQIIVPFDLLSLKSKESGLVLLFGALVVLLQVGDLLLDGGNVLLSVGHGGSDFTMRWVPQCTVIDSGVLKISQQNIYMEVCYENNTVLKYTYRSPLRNRKKKEGCPHYRDGYDIITVIFSAFK